MTAAATRVEIVATEYRKAITAGVIGNVLEWYDFGVYGYLVPTISALFFPGGDPVVSLLSTFAVFGVGFVMRPVGSILFGTYGDRHGRRKALSAVIFVMALATFAMGLLPTYAQGGVLAPMLLVVVRLFQGLSAGGEWGGSTSYIVEFAPPTRRGFFGSWQLVGVGGGFLLGSLTAALLNGALSEADRLAWGWRLPFLFGIAVGLVGAYLRWRLDDTPKYTELEEKHAVAEAPLTEALKQYPRETLLGFGVTLHNTVAYYIALIYMGSYMVTVGKLPQITALWIGTGCLALFVALLPLMGWISDQIGRRPLLIFSCAAYIVLGYPFFLMASSGSVALAILAQLLMVVLYVPYAGACPAYYAEIFPTRVRYTALSIGYNIAVAIFGGFAPFIATFLVRETGSNYAPAFYVIAAAVVTGIILLRTRETAFAPLR
ncbi:MAG TPA: MFS transporter [Stellaceae bacterium]|jgi:MHS family proline/betaine transporter-like MFS transporter|nr:MFS transporter [Stellaceae bacterium]